MTGSADPIVRARAAYWRGRATEAAGRFEEMRAHYEAAARHPTAYYGQLAFARLGLDQVALRSPPQVLNGVGSDLVQAAHMLLAIGERDLFLAFATDLAEESRDAAVVAAVGQLTARDNDARTTLIIGKTALTRGLPVDLYAFPDFGVPAYNPIAPPLDRSLVYSIVRTESGFDQRDVSPAKAVGLMQVTPEAARDTAKRFGVTYDWNRLVSDPVYNTQMGAAELAALLKEYRAPTSWRLPATMRAAAASGNGWRSTAIRAIRGSTPSTGSNASRSPKRATTSSVSWRTCRSTARASTPPSRRSSPTCTALRRSTRAPPRRPRRHNPLSTDLTGLSDALGGARNPVGWGTLSYGIGGTAALIPALPVLTIAGRTRSNGVIHRSRTAPTGDSDGGFDRGEQRGVLQGLRKIGDRAGGFAPLAESDIAVRRDDDGRNLDAVACQVLKQFQAGHLGHLQVDDQAIGQPAGQRVEKLMR